jgi:hypothetical protein
MSASNNNWRTAPTLTLQRRNALRNQSQPQGMPFSQPGQKLLHFTNSFARQPPTLTLQRQNAARLNSQGMQPLPQYGQKLFTFSKGQGGRSKRKTHRRKSHRRRTHRR